MPWTAKDMVAKGVRSRLKARLAARRANAILRKSGNEGKAIRIALALANNPQRVAMHRRVHRG